MSEPTVVHVTPVAKSGTIPVNYFLLQEDGFQLLQEDGSALLIDASEAVEEFATDTELRVVHITRPSTAVGVG